MKWLLCQFLGHRWKIEWDNPYGDTWAYAQCAWCKEPGWAVRVK